MEKVIEAIHANSVTDQEMHLFISYCGWDAAVLEAEVDEGSWIVV